MKFGAAAGGVQAGITQDILRLQVGGALDAFEGGAGADRQRAREHGFGHARHVFNQQMPFREQHGNRQGDLIVFSDDDLFHVGDELLGNG